MHPIIWEKLPGMMHSIGLIAAHSFAELAGITQDNIKWISGFATIAGWDYHGNWLSVTFINNQPNAFIRRGTVPGAGNLGEHTVDIATYVEGLSGPIGTVRPFFRNNRIYLPFRFLFNAFGYSADFRLERDGQVVRVVALP